MKIPHFGAELFQREGQTDIPKVIFAFRKFKKKKKKKLGSKYFDAENLMLTAIIAYVTHG
jgi:hypothetical protein